MKIRLGINAAFAACRYPEPEVWLKIVGEELNLRYVQFFSDLIDPKVEEKTKKKLCRQTKKAARKYKVAIHSLFTGTAPHWSHFLLHPDKGMRKDAIGWWENYIKMAPLLGAKAIGSFLGSFSVRDSQNPKRKKELTEELIRTWHHFARLAKKEGLEYLMFEPMSVPREMPCTIRKAEKLYRKLNQNAVLPTKLCLDVGHGAAISGTKEDKDPYAWIKHLGSRSAVIHIQQTDGKSSKHWPFTKKYNKIGIIKAEKVLEAIEKSGAREILLVIEVFHSFFEPAEYKILDDLKESVNYWRRCAK